MVRPGDGAHCTKSRALGKADIRRKAKLCCEAAVTQSRVESHPIILSGVKYRYCSYNHNIKEGEHIFLAKSG